MAAIERAAEDAKLSHLKKESSRSYVLIFTATIGTVFGVNILFELLQITQKSEIYQAIREDQYAASLLVGLICYGVISAFSEEVLFRGILYNALKRTMNVKLAMVLSAFLFGAYHMNNVQGTYGFVMGCLMAFGYEYFGSFLIPVAIHMVSNILAYAMGYTPIGNTGFVSWPACMAFLVLGVGSIFFLVKEKDMLQKTS
ncbi:CPBP family intramembrane metalloprotease [Lachnospiraceae bacterium OttesenSCG-928-D06]|nr:CPBP family intramembrane metalloprotease [Lachnospiraceae bacterium OttesenSCG-928-D06]